MADFESLEAVDEAIRAAETALQTVMGGGDMEAVLGAMAYLGTLMATRSQFLAGAAGAVGTVAGEGIDRVLDDGEEEPITLPPVTARGGTEPSMSGIVAPETVVPDASLAAYSSAALVAFGILERETPVSGMRKALTQHWGDNHVHPAAGVSDVGTLASKVLAAARAQADVMYTHVAGDLRSWALTLLESTSTDAELVLMVEGLATLFAGPARADRATRSHVARGGSHVVEVG